MVEISPQAQIAIRSLLPVDRKRVERQLSFLERFPEDEHFSSKVRKLDGDQKDLYIMRASGTLRIIFRYDADKAEVLDVITHERLKRIAAGVEYRLVFIFALMQTSEATHDRRELKTN